MACISCLSCLKSIIDAVRCHHKQRQALAQTSDNDRMFVDLPLDGPPIVRRPMASLTGPETFDPVA